MLQCNMEGFIIRAQTLPQCLRLNASPATCRLCDLRQAPKQSVPHLFYHLCGGGHDSTHLLTLLWGFST